MMQTKDINEITVKDLTELVDINRSTFYIHYKDIYQLLEAVEQEILSGLEEIFNPGAVAATDPAQVLRLLYHFLYENKNTVSAFLGPHGDDALLNRVQTLLRDKIHENFSDTMGPEISEYCSAFCFTGCMGVVKEWIKTGCAMSPDDIADLTNQFLIHGIAINV